MASTPFKKSRIEGNNFREIVLFLTIIENFKEMYAEGEIYLN